MLIKLVNITNRKKKLSGMTTNYRKIGTYRGPILHKNYKLNLIKIKNTN